jgi:hypothetical protein
MKVKKGKMKKEGEERRGEVWSGVEWRGEERSGVEWRGEERSE